MADIPFFFHDDVLEVTDHVALNDDTARHVAQALRMREGDEMTLVNGKGYKATASIVDVQKRRCNVAITNVEYFEQPETLLHLGVSFTKNTSRNEWLLEKVTELGVATIIPLVTQRSERNKFRFDRWHNILVAALIQSQQYYLPELKDLTKVEEVITSFDDVPQKLVAHCMDDVDRKPISQAVEKVKETILLIGPEGDFTEEEVNQLTSKGYNGISMGSTRLRTETAGVTACAYFNMVNHG